MNETTVGVQTKDGAYNPPDMWIEGREDALNSIREERCKQFIKWGSRDYDDGTWAKIMGEEFGEVCKAMMDIQFPKPDAEPDALLAHLRLELTHLAASAAAMIQQIDKGEA